MIVLLLKQMHLQNEVVLDFAAALGWRRARIRIRVVVRSVRAGDVDMEMEDRIVMDVCVYVWESRGGL